MSLSHGVRGEMNSSHASEGHSVSELTGKWIREHDYFQGPCPPEGYGSRDEWIELEHQAYIPVSKAHLLDAFRDRFENEGVPERLHAYLAFSAALGSSTTITTVALRGKYVRMVGNVGMGGAVFRCACACARPEDGVWCGVLVW